MSDTDMTTRNWIPKGVAFYDLDQEVVTENYVFVLLHNFSMNAFSSAIEPLRIANQLTGKELFHWRCVSFEGTPVQCSNGIPVGVDGTLGDISDSDIVFVCSGILPEASCLKPVADRIRHFWRRGQTVGGICTGAYTLASAGILQGSEFTLHWENRPAFCELYPHLEPLDQVYVLDGRIWTCAGGLAATDMMVSRIRDLYGKELAGTVANMCLYHTPRPGVDPQMPSTAAMIGNRHDKLLRILAIFEERLDEEFNMDDVAFQVDLSRRQLERLFQRHMGTSPKKHLTHMRLQRGRSMLSETNLSVQEVAAACGFGTTANFSKSFAQLFGISPHKWSVMNLPDGRR